MKPKGQNRLWRVAQAWFQEIDVLKHENTHNSFKTGVSRPTGFNMNPKGQNRLWRVAQAWFQEIDVRKHENTHNSFKTGVSRPTGFNMNPKGQNRLWRVAQAWFHENYFLEAKMCEKSRVQSRRAVLKGTPNHARSSKEHNHASEERTQPERERHCR